MEMPFTRHCGTRIFPMSWGGSHWHHDFNDDEAWKVWKTMESCGAAWVGSSDWANHLQNQVKETMMRRKERFLSAAEAARQETNTCKYSRFESVESQFLCFEYSVPTHCIAFTSPKTKNRKTREPSAHSKPLTRDFSIPFACHAKENLVPLLGLSDSRAYVLALHILWSMMWAPKSNRPTCLR